MKAIVWKDESLGAEFSYVDIPPTSGRGGRPPNIAKS
jgi:hypothetical protein